MIWSPPESTNEGGDGSDRMRECAMGLLIGLAATGVPDAAEVPSSARSREVVRRVTPALEDALGARGLGLGASRGRRSVPGRGPNG